MISGDVKNELFNKAMLFFMDMRRREASKFDVCYSFGQQVQCVILVRINNSIAC